MKLKLFPSRYALINAFALLFFGTVIFDTTIFSDPGFYGSGTLPI